MNLLELFFAISGLLILILGIDIARKQKFNALHFIVFISIGGGLLIFTFFPRVLESIGGIFGLQRGADLLVYSSIIFLIYISLLLLRKVEGQRDDVTFLVRELAISGAKKISEHHKVCILMRAYNEGKVIRKTILELIDAGYPSIILINDGSTDNTLDEVAHCAHKGQIVVLSHAINRGGGAALETGFEYIRRYVDAKYIVTFDADGQHDVDDISQIHTYFADKEVDILLGSRFLGKESVGMPICRRLILKFGILFTALLSHIRLSDAHNGFRVFRMNALKKIHLTIDGMGYASEMIDIIATQNIPYREIPVHIRYSDYSLLKGQKSSNAINIAFKFIWSKFFK